MSGIAQESHFVAEKTGKNINKTLLAALPGIPVKAGLLGFVVFDFKEKFVNSSVELVNSCPWRFCCCDELGSVEKGWV